MGQEHKNPMLVGVVELVKEPEGVLSATIPLLVRLESLDTFCEFAKWRDGVALPAEFGVGSARFRAWSSDTNEELGALTDAVDAAASAIQKCKLAS